MNIWVPAELLREGIGPILISVLIDLERAPQDRRLPPSQESYVYDRDGYWKACEKGLATLRRANPNVAALGDPLFLTEEGEKVLRRYREALAKVSAPKGHVT